MAGSLLEAPGKTAPDLKDEESTSDLLRLFDERGYIYQCSDPEGLDTKAGRGEVVAYVGYDCTAPSLHVGSLISIMMLHWVQQFGGKPIALMGGGTTRIGDPSGQDRDPQDAHRRGDRGQQALDQRPSRASSTSARRADGLMVDNADWLAPLNYIDFLRDIGRHFSVNRMLSFEAYKIRIESGALLHRVQLPDPAGLRLPRALRAPRLPPPDGRRRPVGQHRRRHRAHGRRVGTPSFALTFPLLTTAAGAKMGKTAKGAVWLNADMLGPYDYCQYWRNTEDADVERFLKLFTTLPLAEIARLAALGGSEINAAKKVLATEATALLHGREAAARAAETAHQAFEQGTSAEGLPSFALDLETGVNILDCAGVKVGFANSRGEARRAIQGGAIRVNDVTVSDERMVLSRAQLGSQGAIKLSFGKKKHVLIKDG